MATTKISTRLASWSIAFFFALLVSDPMAIEAGQRGGRGGGGSRGGGGGGGRSAARTSVTRDSRPDVNRNVNRDVDRNRDVNRNVDRNRDIDRDFDRDIDVDRDFDRDIDVDVDLDDRWDGCCYGGLGTAAAIATTAAVTAAAIGSVVYALPVSCSTVIVDGYTYQQCGSDWYQPQISGGSTTYVVVDEPR